ncbi:DUF6318 family protein [Demequina aestuarii]|uniref:DUF6318 family protein n=1 Tax=Demequina aestuarii TaxID=327095 RepID=UPI0007804AB0|nr:DUF6318 family protein [Demequina aestuarii]
MVALVAAGLVTGGCGGDPEPIVTETPTATPALSDSPTPSPTPSPSATPLTDEEVIAAIPPLARQEDFIGAQEFAKYFLTQYHTLMRTEPQLFDALSKPSCRFCSVVQEHYGQVAANGHQLTDGHVTVTSDAAKGGLQEDGTWGVVLDISVDTLVEVDADGAKVEETAGGPGSATLLLSYTDHWVVLEVSAEQQ